MNPTARRDQILFEEVDDELVLFDQDRDHAFVLNKTAAVVWQHCDGAHDVAALTAELRHTVSDAADDDLVRLTLDQLASSRLIEGVAARTPAEIRLDRREYVRKTGVVGSAALALPTVTTMHVPAAAAATSCDSCVDCIITCKP